MSTILISDNLRSLVCEQIAHETNNSNIYFYICGYLKNKGLDGIAKIFEEQRTEEFGHAKMFFDLLTDLNGEIQILEVPKVELSISSISDIANAYVEREIITTDKINALRHVAMEEDNSVAEEMFRKMITIQQKEYEEALTFQDKANLMPEWWQCALWDASL